MKMNRQKENFSLVNNKVTFDPDNPYYSYRQGEGLNSFFKTVSPQGNIIYTISEASYNEEIKPVMLALKNGIDDAELDKYLEYIHSKLSFIISNMAIDYIVPVPSSSGFMFNIMKKIYSKYSLPEATFLSITKTPIAQLKFNKRSPLLQEYERDEIAELKNEVFKYIQLQVDDGNEYLEAKRFPKLLLPLVTNFFTLKGDLSQLSGKNVLMLDDNIASGTTIKDIVDMMSIQCKSRVYGLTLFKLVK